MKIDPKDKPLLALFLATPASVALLLLALRILPPEHPANQATQQQANASGGGKISILDWFFGLTADDYIALFTFATLCVLVFQAIFMRDTVYEMRRANTTAEAANKATRDVIAAENRPWLGVEGVPVPPLEIGQRANPQVIMKNFGKLPAFKVRGGFVARIQTDGGIPDIPPILDAMTDSVTQMPGVPLFHYPFNKLPPVTDADMAAITSGALVLWIVGRVEYFDGAGTRHETDCLMKYTHSMGSFGSVEASAT